MKRSLYSRQMSMPLLSEMCLNHFVIDKVELHNRDIVNKTYVDYKIRLVDHLISDHGDRMSMANSVEVRYPFWIRISLNSLLKCHDLKLKDFTENIF
ncbi:hypothetical protein CS542_07225 [Pedobacter sp. IW39]|nr:hypothetical protein CS542_07225 [Pedobacter sp. IW39]